MSLVERALDKLRTGHPPAERRPPGTPQPPASIGALVEETVESRSGRRIALDREGLRGAGYLPEEDLDRRFADEYRQIKRPLLANAFAKGQEGGRNKRLVMMASALPGDGKTFTSINLALSLAREKDFSVVLVDADVAKPHISRIFGVDAEPGLLDALGDSAVNVASLILSTDVHGLSILPAGKAREAATELLASSRMGEVAGQILLRHPRCVAIFDSPPLIVSTEPRALATWMGQVLLVVRAGQTPPSAVLEALEQLPEGVTVSTILNQGRHSLLQGYYAHNYGSYGHEQDAT